MREWLDATKMRDGPGGWSMRGYLSLGEAPPTRGRWLVFIANLFRLRVFSLAFGLAAGWRLRDVWRSARLCRQQLICKDCAVREQLPVGGVQLIVECMSSTQ